jgi:voltage-gated potassium channel
VLGVVRGGELHRVDSSVVDSLESGDRLLYIRKAGPPDS